MFLNDGWFSSLRRLWVKKSHSGGVGISEPTGPRLWSGSGQGTMSVNALRDSETLKRVIEQGKWCYGGGTSFARWYDKMILDNGTYVRPYLREAWKHMRGGTLPDPQALSAAPRVGKFMKGVNWKQFGAGLSSGLVLGFGMFWLFRTGPGVEVSRQGRFMLIHEGNTRTLKMDTRTGETWYVGWEGGGYVWKPMKPVNP